MVISLSTWAKSIDPDFLIVPQNGQELATVDGEEEDAPATDYLAAIDGQGREDLNYGYNSDNKQTPENDRHYMEYFLAIQKKQDITILVTDYCSTPAKMDSSYVFNTRKGYKAFAADHRDLDNIPSYPDVPYQENDLPVEGLSDVQNFLYVLDPGGFGETKEQFVAALDSTTYDLFIIDLFSNDETQLTAGNVAELQTKPGGARRLVICYMSIGEAETYRYYWQQDWKVGNPSFIAAENPDWAGNYKVRYWVEQWQDIIFGNDSSYLKRVLDASFDGVYLDVIDAFEYFE